MIGVCLPPRMGPLCALRLGILMASLIMLPIGVSEAGELESADVVSSTETVESSDETSEASALIDRLQHKTLLLQTAKGLDQGDVVLTGYDGPVWLEGRVGLTDWLELDGYFSYLHAYLIGGGEMRVHFPVGDHLDIAVGASGGYMDIVPFYHDFEDNNMAWFGGSFELTAEFERHLLTFSAAAHGIHAETCMGDRCDYDGPIKDVLPGALMITGLGYRYRVNDFWSVQTEATAVFYSKMSLKEFKEEAVLLLTGGGRWHTGRVFGDLGLIYPLSSWYYDGGAPGLYFPLGIPYFSVGVML